MKELKKMKGRMMIFKGQLMKMMKRMILLFSEQRECFVPAVRLLLKGS